MERIGVGVDIEEIARFENFQSEQENDFLNRVFTKRELQYCFSQKSPAQHLAARFSGKEAVIKSLNSLGIMKSFAYNAIEILRNKKGVPQVKILDFPFEIHMSLSHSRNYAIAFVVCLKK